MRYLLKPGEGLDVERRGTRAGHQYNLLGHIGSNTSGVVVEPYLITLTEDSDVFPTFQHEGMEFLFMLEGEVVYRHGSNLYHLAPGDSLFFDADAPHGPEELTRLPMRYLSIICYPQNTARQRFGSPALRPVEAMPSVRPIARAGIRRRRIVGVAWVRHWR